MKKFSRFLWFSMGVLLLWRCDIETQSLVNPNEKSFTYDFVKDAQGWEGLFADYPIDEEKDYELSFRYDTLPENLPRQGALRISGNNHSDDLFMFFRKQLGGLKPNTAYNIYFTIVMASQYPENAVGVGGSPGASVALLVGAMRRQPITTKGDLGYDAKVPNFDHRIPFERGEMTEDVLNIGNIGIPGEEFIYTLITRSNEDIPFVETTDKNGKLWVIVGTDSGFEAVTTLFYDQIEITFREK